MFYSHACVLVGQSCLTLCGRMDCNSPSGSSVHDIFQVTILEWVPFPSRKLPNPGIEPRSALQADSLP